MPHFKRQSFRVDVRRAALGAASLSVVGALAACGSSAAETTAAKSVIQTGDVVSACLHSMPVAVDSSEHRNDQKPNVLLVLNSPSPAELSAAKSALANAAAIGATVVVTSGDSSTGAPSTQLVGDGLNPSARRTGRCNQLAQAEKNLTAAGEAHGDDVLGALESGFDTIAGLPTSSPATRSSGGEAMIFGSASTTKPIAFTSEALERPDVMLGTLAHYQLLRTCHGWRFGVFSADARDTGWLGTGTRRFWREYARQCGGRLVEWTTSYVPLGNTEVAAPASFIPRATAPAQPVRIGCDTTYTVSAANFALNSNELTQPAVDRIAALTQQARSAASAMVRGYTDDTTTPGDPTFNDGLSKQRADAVASLLRHLVPTLSVAAQGMGASHPIAPNTDATRYLNRRVEITFHQSGTCKN